MRTNLPHIANLPSPLWAPEDGGGGGADPEPRSGGGDADRTQPAGDPRPSGITLTPDQLAGRINSARSKAERDAIEGVFSKLGVASEEEFEAAVAKLREGESEAKRLERERTAIAKERDQLVTELATLRKADRQRQRRDAIHDAISAEAQKGRKVVSVAQIERLLAPDLGFDDDGKLAVMVDGAVAHGKSVHKHLAEFLDANANLVEATPGQGAGSRTGSAGSGGSEPPDYRKLSGDDRAKALGETMARLNAKG